ncbi:MAG: CotH kinase family protein [Bacteroidales bacterium]
MAAILGPWLLGVGLSFQLQAQDLVINEIMASNSSSFADGDGDFGDWIEIYNPSDAAVGMSGYGLSDDVEHPFRWVFPSAIIHPGQYMVIWASGKDRRDPQSELHANFSVSASGEDILLTHPSGTRTDSVPATVIPTGISMGRKPDGADKLVFFKTPTPGQSNKTEGYEGMLPDLVFSHEPGFFTSGFELEVSSTIPGVTIFYTLDGSTPGEDSNAYAHPMAIGSLEGTPNDISLIPTNDNPNPGPPYYEGWMPPAGEIQKVNVVRAVARKENFIDSRVSTMTYVIDELGTERYTLPVFSLNTDRENLFDPEIGIYIPGEYGNMWQRGDAWERPVHIAFFEKDGGLAFSGDMGVRIHGGTSRSRPRKSLRFYLRGDYGDPWLNYRLFPEKDTDQYKRFLLRNSGNDWDQALFRDGFLQYLARDLHVDTQFFRPAILFVNGEYWGIHGIRDRYDAHYIFSHYGLEEHEIVGMENNSVFDYGNPEGVHHYNAMRSFIANNNMAHEPNLDHVKTLMDTESFIDFQIANIFIMNTDWPGNNLVYWRRITNAYDPEAPPGLDGRWRWKMLDTDFGFGLNFNYVVGVNQGPAHNTLAMAVDPGGPSWPNPPWSTMLLRKLLTNQGFRRDFINRFADLMNTTFREKHVVAVIDSIAAALSPEMPEHIHRWRRPVDMGVWKENLDVMRDFARVRPWRVRQHITGQFQLNGILELDLGVNDPVMGRIRLNTIVPELDGRWTGIYFQGVPVSLEALPSKGFRFSHWSGANSGNGESLVLTLHGNAALTAHFELDPDFEGDALNPQAYPLQQGPYRFDYWNENEPEGNFPPHMLFLQSDMDDPGLEDEMTHRYHVPASDYHADDAGSVGFAYRLSGRTRINGLGEQGISFINTGRGRDLGAALLALDTRGVQDVFVSWTGGTLIPNARVYAIRLQYRIGLEGPFSDLLDGRGNPLEYMRSDAEGHERHFDPVKLPAAANNQAFVQLRWKYYYTGEQLEADHGRRDMLRLDDILVTASGLTTGMDEGSPGGTRLEQNAPNPFSEQTRITFRLQVPSRVRIDIFDAGGNLRLQMTDRLFPEGSHSLDLEGSLLKPGVYFYRMTTEDFSGVMRFILLR